MEYWPVPSEMWTGSSMGPKIKEACRCFLNVICVDPDQRRDIQLGVRMMRSPWNRAFRHSSLNDSNFRVFDKFWEGCVIFTYQRNHTGDIELNLTVKMIDIWTLAHHGKVQFAPEIELVTWEYKEETRIWWFTWKGWTGSGVIAERMVRETDVYCISMEMMLVPFMKGQWKERKINCRSSKRIHINFSSYYKSFALERWIQTISGLKSRHLCPWT